MTPIRFGLAAFFAAMVASAASTTDAAPASPVIFIHVNVVPMDSARVLKNQSVLVEDGTIKAVGEKVEAPAGATTIDGHGTEYLFPGLADMHQHSTTSRDMAVLLANGVTSVLNMGGATTGFVDHTVPALNRGELPGPHVYLSWKVDGTPEYGELAIATPAQARGLVSIAKTNGYDFIKVYNNLSPEVFKAFVDEGRKQGIPVIGHGVTRVGIERQLAEGQVMVAHAEEYFYTVFFPPGVDVSTAPPRLDQIPSAIAFTKKYHAFVTADLNTYATIAKQWGKPDVVTSFLAMPTVRYLDPDDRISWRYEGYVKRKGSIDARLEFLKVFIKDMADAGVPLIAGTDSPPIPGLVPGYSLHQDLQALEEAGLTRFQVLSTATRTAGEFIAQTKPEEQHFGTITAGDRADLILCASNPLDGLSALDTPIGVMAKGHWYDAAALKALLDGVADKYRAAANPGSP